MRPKIMLSLFVGLFVFVKSSNAQLFPWYEVSPAHRAYSAGLAFNSDIEFVRGFCFAFDAVSPTLQGYTVSVFKVTVGQFTTTHIAYPFTVNSSALLECYYSVYFHLPSIPAGPERTFWAGYAELLLQASYNPNILYMDPGDFS